MALTVARCLSYPGAQHEGRRDPAERERFRAAAQVPPGDEGDRPGAEPDPAPPGEEGVQAAEDRGQVGGAPEEAQHGAREQDHQPPAETHRLVGKYTTDFL